MTTPAARCCPCPPAGSAAGFLLCDCPPVGDCTQFIRVYTAGGGFVDTTLDRLPYVPTGTVGSCCDPNDDTGACASQLTPVAVAQLCREDGTPIVVVVQRDCDGTVSAPGWVNLVTGVFTAGLAPADAAPCDGSVATAGSAGRLVLCDVQADDSVVGFLRAIDGDGVVTDTTIDGLPYVPTGTVGLCEALAAAAAVAQPCESPTTPISTTGLCLADGTPVATVAQRDCDGVVTQSGWLNLTNGAFTLGLPPAGTTACGASQSIQVSGVFCDVDPGTGEVFALVLVEYTYAPDGSIESVRIVLAADGTTYVLQGVLSICPGSGSEMDVETQLMCLVDAGGVLISQVIAEFGYTTSTGARLFLRFTNPTTGAVIAPPAGATAQDCGGVAGVGTDVETQLLCVVDAGGVLIAQVVAEYGYNAATGARVFVRYTNPTTGAVFVPPAGSTVQECAPCDTPVVLGEVCYSPPVIVPDVPLPVTNLLMQGSAFNDAAGEDICVVVPAPTSETGWTVIGACRNPTVSNPTLGWAGPIQSVAMEYGDATSGNADGGVNVAFSSTETGPITWPVNLVNMTVGETRVSNVALGGRFARVTYVSGPTGSNAPRMPGGGNINIHQGNVSNVAPIRFRLDLFGPGSIATDETFAPAAVTRECDGSIVYTDVATGTVLDLADVVLAPCPATGSTDVETQVLCLVDAGGVFLSEVIAEFGYDTVTGDRVFARYTDPTTGAAVVPPVGATVQACTDAMAIGSTVRTGVRRLAGASVVALSAVHPGLQAVTMTVLSGQGTVTTDDGTITVPAGMSLSWSVDGDSDESLGTWTGGGVAVGSDVVLNFTYKT